MKEVRAKIGREECIIATGKLAKQAGGSVTVQYGGTMVLVTACCSKQANEAQGFFPLVVEYQEKTFAAGKIPGGFFKREGKPSQKEILTSRVIDRPIRPLFPYGMLNEVQVVASVLSFDGKNDSDVCAIIGASAALTISEIPFNGPIAGARVGLIDDKFVINPTFEELENSKLNLIVVANDESVIMLEAGAAGISEDKMTEAIKFGHDSIKPLLAAQKELQKKAGKPKREDITMSKVDEGIYKKVKQKAPAKFREMFLLPGKKQRLEAHELIKKQFVEELSIEGEDTAGKVELALEKVEEEVVRDIILKEKKRVDGRKFDEIRQLSSEINILPRTHGSGLFTRGETQALAVTTLGTSEDEQRIDALEGESLKSFMLHYNFPPFSVGETKPMRGPGRREIGHGALAEKALHAVMPTNEEFPYTVRVVSEILESNGSSSMATVCAGSLSLMAAGVPIKSPVSGIAMGLVKEDSSYAILTDIAGVEDHLGDMDFKVAGTKDGITAVQMDLKIEGISYEILKEAFERARKARIEILEHMAKTISSPLEDISPNAPRIVTIKIKPDKIRDVIGSGGKVIRKIIADTGAEINIEDDGTCQVASADKGALDKALEIIKGIVAEPEIGKVYDATIVKIMDFGAFCEFLPGQEGLIHVSELSDSYVKDVSSVVKEGDAVKVKLIGIDEKGRVKLSMKAVKKQD